MRMLDPLQIADYFPLGWIILQKILLGMEQQSYESFLQIQVGCSTFILIYTIFLEHTLYLTPESVLIPREAATGLVGALNEHM